MLGRRRASSLLVALCVDVGVGRRHHAVQTGGAGTESFGIRIRIGPRIVGTAHRVRIRRPAAAAGAALDGTFAAAGAFALGITGTLFVSSGNGLDESAGFCVFAGGVCAGLFCDGGAAWAPATCPAPKPKTSNTAIAEFHLY